MKKIGWQFNCLSNLFLYDFRNSLCKEEKRERGKMGKEELDKLIYKIIGTMIEVHKELGPGFLESVYRNAIVIELQKQGIAFESEKEITLHYKGENIGTHRLDLFVEKELVVELKTVEELQKNTMLRFVPI